MDARDHGIPAKRRTRQHMIGDLGVNHVERHVLLAGFTVLRVHPDYGYDLLMYTYNRRGEAEPGSVYFQVKATDRVPLLKDGRTITWVVSRRDLKLWLRESYPVVLVVYDGKKDRAYWLSVQEYFADRPTRDLFTSGQWINVHIPVGNRLNRHAIDMIALQKRSSIQRRRREEGSHA